MDAIIEPSADPADATDRHVLLPGVRRVAIEAGHTSGWWRYVGLDGAVIGIDRFGESGPGDAVLAHFGFTADRVVEGAIETLGRDGSQQ